MTNAEFTFPVDAGHIMQFARAIGDPNPISQDPTHVAGNGAPGILAPPTFLVAADHHDPTFDRRPTPHPEEGTAADRVFDAALHVSQSFEFRRSVRAGDCLKVRRLPHRTWTKHGRRGGRLDFVEAVTEYHDLSGLLVARSSWIDVHTERSHAELSATPSPASASVSETPPGPHLAGHCVPVAQHLSRTQIVMYVGASGDFHPLHHDDVYARLHGYPGVFAPGMLTMAVTGRAVTDVIGIGCLTRFEGRFSGQVWPGDSLWTSVHQAPGDAGSPSEVSVSVTTANQHGAIVFAGSATARRAAG